MKEHIKTELANKVVDFLELNGVTDKEKSSVLSTSYRIILKRNRKVKEE